MSYYLYLGIHITLKYEKCFIGRSREEFNNRCLIFLKEFLNLCDK